MFFQRHHLLATAELLYCLHQVYPNPCQAPVRPARLSKFSVLSSQFAIRSVSAAIVEVVGSQGKFPVSFSIRAPSLPSSAAGRKLQFPSPSLCCRVTNSVLLDRFFCLFCPAQPALQTRVPIVDATASFSPAPARPFVPCHHVLQWIKKHGTPCTTWAERSTQANVYPR